MLVVGARQGRRGMLGSTLSRSPLIARYQIDTSLESTATDRTSFKHNSSIRLKLGYTLYTDVVVTACPTCPPLLHVCLPTDSYCARPIPLDPAHTDSRTCHWVHRCSKNTDRKQKTAERVPAISPRARDRHFRDSARSPVIVVLLLVICREKQVSNHGETR